MLHLPQMLVYSHDVRICIKNIMLPCLWQTWTVGLLKSVLNLLWSIRNVVVECFRLALAAFFYWKYLPSNSLILLKIFNNLIISKTNLNRDKVINRLGKTISLHTKQENHSKTRVWYEYKLIMVLNFNETARIDFFFKSNI